MEVRGMEGRGWRVGVEGRGVEGRRWIWSAVEGRGWRAGVEGRGWRVGVEGPGRRRMSGSYKIARLPGMKAVIT